MCGKIFWHMKFVYSCLFKLTATANRDKALKLMLVESPIKYLVYKIAHDIMLQVLTVFNYC